MLYPRAGRSGDSHAPLGEALLRDDLSLVQDIAREARGWRALLISTEHLSCLGTAGFAALRDAFPTAEFRVSYTLRRLAGLWPSHWAELVKHGQRLSFGDYLDRVVQRDDRPFHAPILPLRQLDLLAEAFGTAALHVSVHDQRIAEGIDLGPAFIDNLLGLGQIAQAFSTRLANTSPSELETALVYLLNQHAGPRANHVTKQRARQILLAGMRRDPARGWLSPLQAAINRAGRIAFGSDHPLVAAEQGAVIARYGEILPDGVESYLAPVQTSVLRVDRLHLAPAEAAALSAPLDAALAAVRADWLRR